MVPSVIPSVVPSVSIKEKRGLGASYIGYPFLFYFYRDDVRPSVRLLTYCASSEGKKKGHPVPFAVRVLTFFRPIFRWSAQSRLID